MTLSSGTAKPMEGGASFSFSNRLQRVVWHLVWGMIGRWTPPPLNGWRCFLVRCFGGDIASTAKIYGGVNIWLPRNLRMAARSCLGPRATCYCIGQVTLEEYAIVSQGAHLCTGTHLIDDPDFPLVAYPIRIGRRAWVGAEAFVGPGVTMEDGSVLGARSVAVKDIAAWTVAAGSPARAIRSRKRHD